MTSTAKSPYAGYRFPGEVISHAVWLYFRFPLSLRMVEEGPDPTVVSRAATSDDLTASGGRAVSLVRP
jgi:putative transposase